MQERMDAAVVEWARRIPVDQIPYAVASLLVRFWTECNAGRTSERTGASASDPDKLLTARQLAERLNVPESWVRNEERAGQIPSVRLGKYVRFKWPDVERALAERARREA